MTGIVEHHLGYDHRIHEENPSKCIGLYGNRHAASMPYLDNWAIFKFKIKSQYYRIQNLSFWQHCMRFLMISMQHIMAIHVDLEQVI